MQCSHLKILYIAVVSLWAVISLSCFFCFSDLSFSYNEGLISFRVGGQRMR